MGRLAELKRELGFLEAAAEVAGERTGLSPAWQRRLEDLRLAIQTLEIKAKLAGRRPRGGPTLEDGLASGELSLAEYRRIKRSLAARVGPHGEERRSTGPGGDYHAE